MTNINKNADNKVLFLNIDGSDYYLPGEGPIYYIAGGGTAVSDTEAAWTGTHPRINEYYEGLTIIYKIGIAGDTTTTLNINNLGAVKVVKNATTNISTSYPVNSIVILVYTTDSSGISYWKVSDQNTDNYVRVYRNNGGGYYPFIASYTTAAAIGSTSNNKSYEGAYSKIAHNNSYNMFINVANGAVSPWNTITRGPLLSIASITEFIPGPGFNNAVKVIINTHKHTANFIGTAKNTENTTIKPAGTVNVTHSLTTNHTHTFTGAAANHNHTFSTSGSTSSTNATVSGTINASFAGTNKAVSVSGTPAGTISKPSITVTPSTVNANAVVTKAGTRSTLTQSYNGSTKILTLNFTTGSNTTMNNSIKLMTGASAALAANPTFTGSALTSTGYYTPEGTITVSHSLAANHSHTFNKSFTTNNTSIAPAGTITATNAAIAGSVNATFTGNEISHNHNFTAEGSISISTPAY